MTLVYEYNYKRVLFALRLRNFFNLMAGKWFADHFQLLEDWKFDNISTQQRAVNINKAIVTMRTALVYSINNHLI